MVQQDLFSFVTDKQFESSSLKYNRNNLKLKKLFVIIKEY
jgi:hypothetical protein